MITTGPAPAPAVPDRHLADQLARWTAAGVITPGQAARIAELEAQSEPPAPRPAREAPVAALRPRRLSLASEVLAYLGGLLATVAALLIGVRLWHELSTAGRISLLAVVTAALLGAGFWLAESHEPAAIRLRAFLWFASTVALAGTAGVVAADAFDLGPGGVGLVVGVAVTVYAGVLWWLLPTALQVLALSAGVVASALFVLLLSDVKRPAWYALVLAAIGLLTAWLGVREMVRPRDATLALGAVEVLIACQVLAADLHTTGAAIAVAVTLGMLSMGILRDELLLMWLGVAGTFAFLPQLIVDIAGNTIGLPIGLLAAGIVLLAVAMRRVRHGGDRAQRGGSPQT